MSNIMVTATSNIFAVKDPEKFMDFCSLWNLDYCRETVNPMQFSVTSGEDAGIPQYAELDDGTELDQDEFFRNLTEQLAVGEVATFVEVSMSSRGNDGGGSAMAINWKGEQKWIDLEIDIEKIAQTMKKET